MVDYYEDMILRSLEVVLPLCHSSQVREEIPIIRVVVLFGTATFLRVEVEWTLNPETNILVENSGFGKATCIGLLSNRLGPVEMVENECIGEGMFQLPKCKFGIPCPFPFELFRRPGILCFLRQV